MDESAWDEKSSSGVYVWNANYPVRPGSGRRLPIDCYEADPWPALA